MSGRNGVDRLCFALLILYLILGAVNLFFRTPVLQILMLLVLVYLVFRILSKTCTAAPWNAKSLIIYGKL